MMKISIIKSKQNKYYFSSCLFVLISYIKYLSASNQINTQIQQTRTTIAYFSLDVAMRARLSWALEALVAYIQISAGGPKLKPPAPGTQIRSTRRPNGILVKLTHTFPTLQSFSRSTAAAARQSATVVDCDKQGATNHASALR